MIPFIPTIMHSHYHPKSNDFSPSSKGSSNKCSCINCHYGQHKVMESSGRTDFPDGSSIETFTEKWVDDEPMKKYSGKTRMWINEMLEREIEYQRSRINDDISWSWTYKDNYRKSREYEDDRMERENTIEVLEEMKKEYC